MIVLNKNQVQEKKVLYNAAKTVVNYIIIQSCWQLQPVYQEKSSKNVEEHLEGNDEGGRAYSFSLDLYFKT